MTVVFIAPADHRAIAAQSAGVIAPGGDLGVDGCVAATHPIGIEVPAVLADAGVTALYIFARCVIDVALVSTLGALVDILTIESVAAPAVVADASGGPTRAVAGGVHVARTRLARRRGVGFELRLGVV